MGTFGDRLRREREMRGITLEEIAHSTKIGTRNLRALENEEFDLLPGGVFNRGFVRAYAHFLGLDEERCVADYNAALAEKQGPPLTPEQLQAEEEEQKKQKGFSLRDFSVGDYRLTPLLLLLGAVLVLVVGGWLSFKVYKGLHSDPEPVDAATPTTSDASQSLNPRNSREPVLGANANGAINVAIHLKTTCWIAVNADGHKVMRNNLAGGTEQQFAAQQTMEVVVGDISAVELSYNGKPIALHGPPGKTVTLVFSPTGYSSTHS